MAYCVEPIADGYLAGLELLADFLLTFSGTDLIRVREFGEVVVVGT